MAEKDELKWYVLRAISGKENKVKEYLDAEIKNGSFGKFVSQVMVPTEKSTSSEMARKLSRSVLICRDMCWFRPLSWRM